MLFLRIDLPITLGQTGNLKIIENMWGVARLWGSKRLKCCSNSLECVRTTKPEKHLSQSV